MSSVPLPATQIQLPPDITAQVMRGLQIKGLLLGQQYTQDATRSQ